MTTYLLTQINIEVNHAKNHPKKSATIDIIHFNYNYDDIFFRNPLCHNSRT